MDTSSDSNRSDGDDDDDEDGRNRGSRKNSEKNKSAKEEEKPLTVSDLGRIQLTRTQLAKECMKPWFENYIKGAWVRYLIGQRDGAPVYRICEIKGLCPQIVLPYAVENEMVNQQLQLAFGNSLRFFNMDKVSNGPFTEREFNRLVLTCQAERVILPTQSQINDKRDNIKECENRRLTEADVSAIISRRRTLNPNAPNFQKRIAEGSRIRQELQTAAARNDKAEVARLKEELDAYNLRWGDSTAGSDSDISSKPGLKREGSGISLNGDSMLEEISRRNRELNHENARKLQIQEAERRKKAHLERLKQEAAKANSSSEPQRLSDVTLTKEDALTKNPDLASKDIGTQMAHSVELSLPDF
ncbi:hypothetical protein FRC17_003411 [Serendipita sp. 399]|nr:hypothetical protein FRC17_003411 [Serendipita sp. 399]